MKQDKKQGEILSLFLINTFPDISLAL